MKKKPAKSRMKPAVGAILYLGFLVCALGAGTFYGWIKRSPTLARIALNPLAFLTENPKTAFKTNAVNMLILGCDEDRYFHGTYANGQNIYRKYARSDMMLLTRLDFDHNTITGISIPRDTRASVAGRGTHKINAFHELAQVYHWGNPDEVTKKAVENVLGVHVDKVVVLDFEALQKLVDLVGGVDVYVPKDMNYDDNAGELHIHLKKGMQHLNGYDAMCFVRFRHDQESDFGRQERQKELLGSFRQAVFTHLQDLPDIANDGKAALNNALNDDEIFATAAFARRVPQSQIKMGMAPVVDGPGSYLSIDKRKLPEVLREFGFISSSDQDAGSRQ